MRFNRLQTYCKPIYRGLITDGTYIWEAGCRSARQIARRANGGDLYFHRPRAPVLELWQKVGFLEELGTDHIFPAKRIAIATIFDRLDRGICATCTIRVFEECKGLPPPVV